MMKNFIFVVLTVFSLLAVSTCGQREDAKTKPDVTSEYNESQSGPIKVQYKRFARS